MRVTTYPPDFTHPHQKWVTAQVAAIAIAERSAGHGVVVQAGGCAGLWPLALSLYFARVYTFEPEPANVAALQTNVADWPAITVTAAALGSVPGRVGLTRPKAQAGLWRVEGAGDIPQVRLDDVIADPVDALVLDVEGAEVDVWRGAERLITTSRPLLWFEYVQHTDAITDWLTAHGYTRPVPGIGGDGYSVHASRVTH